MDVPVSVYAPLLISSSFLGFFNDGHQKNEDTTKHQKGHHTKNGQPQEEEHVHLRQPWQMGDEMSEGVWCLVVSSATKRGASEVVSRCLGQ